MSFVRSSALWSPDKLGLNYYVRHFSNPVLFIFITDCKIFDFYMTVLHLFIDKTSLLEDIPKKPNELSFVNCLNIYNFFFNSIIVHAEFHPFFQPRQDENFSLIIYSVVYFFDRKTNKSSKVLPYDCESIYELRNGLFFWLEYIQRKYVFLYLQIFKKGK